MSFIDRLLDPFRGKAITIPPYDGAFKPNSALDDAPEYLRHQAPDNLILWQGDTLFSSGPSLYKIVDAVAHEIVSYDADIAAVAVLSSDAIIVALNSGKLIIFGGVHHERTFDHLNSDKLIAPTALAVIDPETVLIAQGSRQNAASDWVADLMSKRASGSVWKLDVLSGKASLLADHLAWPSGLHAAQDGKIYISEAFAHRLVALNPLTRSGNLQPVLTKIPGYPGKLSPAKGGGFWLAIFAPRSRLIEFILQEDAYRNEMLKTINAEHWIAPALASGKSFLEPLQCGSVRTMGVHKPWAPSRSYGLVVRLDENLQPSASFHSRADGNRHGLTSILDTGETVFAAAKGADVIIDLNMGRKQ